MNAKRLMSKVEQLKDTTYNNTDIAIYELMLEIAEIIKIIKDASPNLDDTLCVDASWYTSQLLDLMQLFYIRNHDIIYVHSVDCFAMCILEGIGICHFYFLNNSLDKEDLYASIIKPQTLGEMPEYVLDEIVAKNMDTGKKFEEKIHSLTTVLTYAMAGHTDSIQETEEQMHRVCRAAFMLGTSLYTKLLDRR